MSARQDPVELLVAAWPGSAAAERAMHALRVTWTPALPGLVDAAALVVERDGTTRVTDTHYGGGVVGGVLATGLGLLTGGIGWMWLHGPTLGPLVVRAGEGGLPGSALRALGERTMPGSSVVLVVAEPARSGEIEGALAGQGAEVVRAVVPAHLAGQLATMPPLAFHPSTVDGDVVAVRSTAAVMRAVEVAGAGTGPPSAARALPERYPVSAGWPVPWQAGLGARRRAVPPSRLRLRPRPIGRGVPVPR